MSLLIALIYLLLRTEPVPPNTGVCMSSQEAELVRLVNEYRVQNGLQALPASKWLTATAQYHIWDRINNPYAVGGICNTHSWSNFPPVGVFWQGMCYTSDHAQAAQMWFKPKQISNNIYIGNGYELAADSFPPQTAQQALNQWKNSPSHNTVILQQGVWASVPLSGIGTGIGSGYAVLWFGDGGTTGGLIQECQLDDSVFANGFE